MNHDQNAVSIVIGGADGPTSVFLAGRLGDDCKAAAAVVVTVVLLAAAVIIFRKWKKH